MIGRSVHVSTPKTVSASASYGFDSAPSVVLIYFASTIYLEKIGYRTETNIKEINIKISSNMDAFILF